jgi:hypothetical protein
VNAAWPVKVSCAEADRPASIESANAAENTTVDFMG